MSDILDQAVEAMRRLPPATRDSMAHAILTLAQGGAPVGIEPEHLPSMLEGLAQIERGEFTEGDPDTLVEAAFSRNVA